MPIRLHRLIYCSRNAIQGDSATVELRIQEMLASARHYNRQSGTTGALLFTQGCFVQALEGEQEVLEETFERIQCNDYHRDVTVLTFEPIETRVFPDWDMAYLGQTLRGMPAAEVAAALNDAFRHNITGGENVLRLMHGVIEREWAWAGA